MEDDGMFLNFNFDAGPVKPSVQIKGGSWRDRARIKKASKRPQEDDDPEYTSLATDRDVYGDRAAKRHKQTHQDSSLGTGPDLGGGAQHSAKPPRPVSRSHTQGRQVTSSLFTSNPSARTVFEDDDAEWAAPEPSNAPLADANTFESLGLSPRLAEELVRIGVNRPTAIQKSVIPLMLSKNTDAFVQAETGSGKTFAYLLPMVHRVLKITEAKDTQIHRNSGLFAIIISPTRELAKQTHTVLCQVLRPFPWLVASAITGGESKKAEKARFRKGVNFLVATPGRLADHIDNTRILNFRTVRWLVLDEGDRLMELGFEQELKKVINCLKKVQVSSSTLDGASLAALPDRIVTVLCSATMKINVQKLSEMSLSDAAVVESGKDDDELGGDNATSSKSKAPAQLHQSYVIVPAKLRLVTLLSHLRTVFSRRLPGTTKIIIFMSCADSVNFHFDLLKLGPLSKNDKTDTKKETRAQTAKDDTLETVADAAYITSPATSQVALYRLHGSLPQSVRTATLKSFTSSSMPAVLLTTDIASRGLDIPSVDMVVEYDPAFCFDDHIHRVGRTARAGRSGDALLFLLPGCEEGYLELLKTSTTPTAQSYDKTLQTGLINLKEFPFETHAKLIDGKSFNHKAETLQLHLEQRILNNPRALEQARNGFKSYVRAYATHVKEERCHFNLSELHLGHLAKAFGLRDAPGGMGGAVNRKTAKRKVAKGKLDEAAEVDIKASRDLIFKKSKAMMTGASEFNLG